MAFASSGRKTLLVLTAVAASAVLLWFGNGLDPVWPLMWLAPLPVLLVATRTSWPVAGAAAFVAWLAGSLSFWHYMVGVLGMPVGAWAIVFGIASLLFAGAVLLFRALMLRGHFWSASVAFPAAWVSGEFVNNLTSPHGTAGSLAYTQLHFLPFLQLASVTGPWGMSFVLLLFSAAVAVGIQARRWRITGVSVAMIAVILIFGWLRLANRNSDPTVVVGLIASDETRGIAERGVRSEQLFAEYAAKAREVAAQGAQVIVLPEKLGVVGEDVKVVDTGFQSLVDQIKVPVIVGVVRVEGETKYNEARVYVPAGTVMTYDKQHMLPPFESDLKPGTELALLREMPGTWGVAVCKDMDFTNPARKYGVADVGLMLVPAWDFVVDRSWHGHMAIMRGVENGYSVARAARGGLLTVSDDRGRIVAEARSNAGPFSTLIARVPVQHEKTIYSRLGDWFGWVAIVLLVVAVGRLVF